MTVTRIIEWPGKRRMAALKKYGTVVEFDVDSDFKFIREESGFITILRAQAFPCEGI